MWKSAPQKDTTLYKVDFKMNFSILYLLIRQTSNYVYTYNNNLKLLDSKLTGERARWETLAPPTFCVKRGRSPLTSELKENSPRNSSYFDVQSRLEFEPTEQTHHVIYVNIFSLLQSICSISSYRWTNAEEC